MTDQTTCSSSSADGVVDSSRSYRSVLKATSLLGGATAINVLLGMVRVKCVALLLGPGGLGLMGMFQSIISMTTTLSGMGMNYSGVREIAEARGSGDEERLKTAVATFRRVSLWLGIGGTVALAVLCIPISRLTFGDGAQAFSILCLSSMVMCSMLTTCDAALIQSAQQIGRLAKLNVVGGFVGTVVSLSCFAMWRQGGIVPALIAGAVVQWLLTRHFARQLSQSYADPSAGYSREIAGRLFRFGGTMVVLGFMVSISGYLQRVLILRSLDESALGFFQAAEGLSGLYAGYILGAMGTDFLPRLSAAVSDSSTVNRLVNEQTVVALLIGIPGVVGTICFAPLMMPVFYASNFGPAAELLKWLAVGVFGRLISWPLSFLLMAKGDSRFLWTNVIATLAQLLALWAGLPRLGLNACGYATILSFAVFTLVNLSAARSLTGFRWSHDAWQVIGLGSLALVITGTGFFVLPSPWGFVPGAVVFLVSCFWGYRRLCHLTQIPLVGRLLGRLKRQAV